MAPPKRIAGNFPKEGSMQGGDGPSMGGSGHPDRNHTVTKQGWTSSMDIGRKRTAADRHAAPGDHGPGQIGGRKRHAAGEG